MLRDIFIALTIIFIENIRYIQIFILLGFMYFINFEWVLLALLFWLVFRDLIDYYTQRVDK